MSLLGDPRRQYAPSTGDAESDHMAREGGGCWISPLQSYHFSCNHRALRAALIETLTTQRLFLKWS